VKLEIHYDPNEDPGRGNLNLRAYFASVVGPRRVAHGKRFVKLAPAEGSILLARNQVGLGDECLYVECTFPERLVDNTVVQSVSFRFSDSEDVGDNALLRALTPVFPAYQAVLLPGDELYAQFAPRSSGGILPALAALKQFPLVVSQVSF